MLILHMLYKIKMPKTRAHVRAANRRSTNRRIDRQAEAAIRDGFLGGLSNTLTRWEKGEIIMIFNPRPSSGGQTKGKLNG